MRRARTGAVPTLLALSIGLLLAGCGSSPPESRTVALSWIQMIDEGKGWALAGDRVLRTTDGGARWKDVTPTGFSLARDAPAAAQFLDVDNGWVLTAAGTSVTVFHTTDGGRRWSRTALAAPEFQAAGLDVQFVDPKQGRLLITSDPALGSMHKAVYATEDGGGTWTRTSCTCDRPAEAPGRSAGASLPLTGYPTGMRFRNASDGWVAQRYRGDPGVIPLYKTSDGGRTWTPEALPLPGPYRQGYYANAFPPVFSGQDDREGALLVQLVGRDTAVATYVTADGGSTWAGKAGLIVPTSPGQLAFDFIDARRGWLLSASGEALFHTTDGGEHWAPVTPDRPLGGPTSETQLDFVNDRVGWALLKTKEGSSLLTTRDGGRTWLPVEPKLMP